MKNLFGMGTISTPKAEVKVQTPQTQTELVEEIHEAFYTEVDRLLADAQIKVAKPEYDKEIFKRGQRLNKLGFGNTKTAIVTQDIETKNWNKRIEQDEKNILRDTILFFSQKYPQYKFITEKSVKSICEKYGLVYSSASNFIGDVPEKNLQEIENFKVGVDYLPVLIGYRMWQDEPIELRFYSKQEVEGFLKKGRKSDWYESYEEVREQPISTFEIVAPLSDFNLGDKEIKNFKLVNKPPKEDPIVLQPIFYENQKHYLIVTAWGPEASDPLVMNPKHN